LAYCKEVVLWFGLSQGLSSLPQRHPCIASFLGLPCFCSLVCVHNNTNTRKWKSTGRLGRIHHVSEIEWMCMGGGGGGGGQPKTKS